MSDVKMCRICLRTEVKMYHYSQHQLMLYYEEDMAVQVSDSDGLPQYFCYVCAAILHKFHKFKEKCHSGQKLLKSLLWSGPITDELIHKIDNKDMPNPTLSLITFNITEKDKHNNENISSEEIQNIKTDEFAQDPVLDRNDVDTDCNSDDESEQKHDIDFIDLEDNESITMTKTSTSNNVDIDRAVVDIECEEEMKNKHKFLSRLKVDGLDLKNWKINTISEDEALKEFRAKSEHRKYLAAAFKCTDCFRGFSKKNMLDRHKELRHVQSLGDYECYFCHMRFKLDCYLRKHMRRHYYKYECLRCNLVTPLQNTALLHEEYHSGVTRKCSYCDQEFRHMSTYYSHLRTHRSEHVCTLCGVSFVSRLGLRQHSKLKHIITEIESSDDEAEVNTYCSRCDIRFETRKAYTEHMFHSALHCQGDKSLDDTASDNRKILGKHKQAEIIKRTNKKRCIDDARTMPLARIKPRKQPGKVIKPMSCYQCGQHFPTQRACWQHHLAAHPRTSFYPPSARYVCELCGASLAPGSVIMHKNLHSREKVFNCDTCGKQFYSTISLSRHRVTHTGEKPYACPLCEKKFTQNNSMKLHYRTFHLKQPYPKRNRQTKQKKNRPPEPEASNSEAESDDTLPEAPGQAPGIETAQVADGPQEDNIYLTLA